MYAVIATGGKQITVTPGETVKIEKLENSPGDIVEFDQILMIRGRHKFFLGDPVVQNSKVVAEVIRQGRDAKIIVFKQKRRKGYRKKAGHRQSFTEVKIKEILLPSNESVVSG